MHVYIVTNKPRGVIYTGVTNDIVRRVFEHRNKLNQGFTSKYNLAKLVYAEEWSSPYEAIRREKQIKSWSRARKIDLIEQINPDWKDFYENLL